MNLKERLKRVKLRLIKTEFDNHLIEPEEFLQFSEDMDPESITDDDIAEVLERAIADDINNVIDFGELCEFDFEVLINPKE